MTTPAVLASNHADYVTALSFDYYGRRIASCGGDRSVSVFDLDDHGQWVLGNTIAAAHYTGISGISWAHPEFGQLLVTSGNDGMAIVWEERTEEVVAAESAAVVYHSRWAERTRLTGTYICTHSISHCHFLHSLMTL
jgi:nucleoporin SEH1